MQRHHAVHWIALEMISGRYCRARRLRSGSIIEVHELCRQAKSWRTKRRVLVHVLVYECQRVINEGLTPKCHYFDLIDCVRSYESGGSDPYSTTLYWSGQPKVDF